jgi:hypothetical protein
MPGGPSLEHVMTADRTILPGLLQPRRSEILDRWRALVFGSYPEEAARFFRREKDRFKNPVGQSIHRATETLLDGVLLERAKDGVPEALEAVVRIRAVQEFSPAEAVGFVFLLKRAVREVLTEASPGGLPEDARSELEARIDALALGAFETYTRCREQIFEIRVREAQRRTAGLLERYNRETPAGEPEDTAVTAGPAAKGG